MDHVGSVACAEILKYECFDTRERGQLLLQGSFRIKWVCHDIQVDKDEVDRCRVTAILGERSASLPVPWERVVGNRRVLRIIACNPMSATRISNVSSSSYQNVPSVPQSSLVTYPGTTASWRRTTPRDWRASRRVKYPRVGSVQSSVGTCMDANRLSAGPLLSLITSTFVSILPWQRRNEMVTRTVPEPWRPCQKAHPQYRETHRGKEPR